MLVSPTTYLFPECPETVMFWIYPLNTSSSSGDDNYSENEEIGVQGVVAVDPPPSHTIFSPSYGEIFNTGDFVDASCDCNRRFVFLYMYEDQVVELQLWKEETTG